MSKSVKYSIVVSVYNRPEEMEELLHSLNNQSFKNFELIIVDDGSQISSREVYDSYKKKFQISYYFIYVHGSIISNKVIILLFAIYIILCNILLIHPVE